MASPTEADLTCVREAVGKLVSGEQLQDFDNSDFFLLWRQRYRTERALPASSRELLMATGLPNALIDYLRPAAGDKRIRDDEEDVFPPEKTPRGISYFRCSATRETFWTNLHLATLKDDQVSVQLEPDDEAVELQAKVLQLEGTSVFLGEEELSGILVPAAYLDLWRVAEDLVDQRLQSVINGGPEKSVRLVVTGTPGTGKSVLAWFFLYKLRQKLGKETDVIWQTHSAREQYWLCSDGRVFGADTSSGSFNHLLDRSSTVYIVDGQGAHTKAAMTFVFCSPNKTSLNEFTKTANVEVRFMPAWSKEDLLAARQLFYSSVSEERVRELYGMWGGVPRAVLEKAANTSYQKGMARAFAQSQPITDILRKLGEVDASDDHSHKILHYEVLPGYDDTRVVFASQYVANMAMSKASQEVQAEIRSFLVAQEQNKQAGGMHGQVWESYSHNVLRHAGTHSVRPLAADSVPKSREEEWPGSMVTSTKWPKLLRSRPTATLFLLRRPTHPSMLCARRTTHSR